MPTSTGTLAPEGMMSDDPFRDTTDNPYQASALHVQGGGADDVAYARSRALPPAIIMCLLAAITLLGNLIALPRAIVDQRREPVPGAQWAGQLSAHGMVSLLMLATIVGSIQMMRLRSYRSAVTAASICLIPMCSPCLVLGIPFGVWALIVLSNPRVKSSFH